MVVEFPVGSVVGSEYHTTRYKHKKHLFEKYGGFGISEDNLHDAFDAGATHVVIGYFVDGEWGFYVSHLDDWFEHSHRWMNNRKAGDMQYILPRKHMVLRESQFAEVSARDC